MTQKGIENGISKQLFQALDKIEKLERKLDKTYDVIDEMNYLGAEPKIVLRTIFSSSEVSILENKTS